MGREGQGGGGEAQEKARWKRIWNRVPFVVLDRRGDPRERVSRVNHDFHERAAATVAKGRRLRWQVFR